MDPRLKARYAVFYDSPDPFGPRRRIHRRLAVTRTLMRRLEALGSVVEGASSLISSFWKPK